MMRLDEEETNPTVYTGQVEIHNKVLSAGYNNCKVKVEHLDAMDSANGSVMVVVNGIIVLANSVPRSFNQSFLLVPAAPGKHRWNVPSHTYGAV